MIQCYDDFIDKLLETGFTIGGENGEGVFTLSDSFTDRIRWHTEEMDTDPWEWRMRVLQERDDIAYGKVFFRKSGYITKEWYPYFLAVRRGSLSLEEAYASGLVSREAKPFIRRLRTTVMCRPTHCAACASSGQRIRLNWTAR